MRFKKFASLMKFLRLKKSMRFTRTIGAVTLGTVGVCVAAVAIFVATRQPSRPTNMSTSEAKPQREGTEPTMKKAPVHEPAAVTITGCLERDAETFRLEKTTGADAPKSRSWKSGFLKKRAVSIEVVDATNRLQLPNQVGQRVSVRGVLVHREVRARSVQRVAGSCDN